MSLILDSPRPSASTATTTPSAATASGRLPRWLCWSASTPLVLAAVGLIFLYLTRLPLWHSDIWDHLNYGRQMLQTGRIARTEPLLTLCEGVRMVNLPWLAELSLTLVEQKTGVLGLQFLSALLGAASLLVISLGTTRISRSGLAGVFAAAGFFYVNRHELGVLRPQLFGLLLACILLVWILARPLRFRTAWVGIPLLFTLWANLHGSFVVGLLLLGLAAVGRAGDVLRASQSPRLVLRDPTLHRLLLLLELSIAAVLINPFGPAAYAEVFSVAGHPNMSNMLEWNPLTLRMASGQRFAAMAMCTMLLLGLTPRRVRISELLILTATALLSAWSARMLNWFTPAAALIGGLHFAAVIRCVVLKRSPPLKSSSATAEIATAESLDTAGTIGPPPWIWTLASFGIIWLCLLLNPFSRWLLRGTQPPEAQLVSAETPVAALEWLNTQTTHPRGLAFVPAEWSGYLMHRGSAPLKPLVNIHAHLIPEEVWNDYMRLTHGPADWNGLFDEYGVNMAVISRRGQPALIKRIRESADWKAAFEDRQTIIFVRRQPV